MPRNLDQVNALLAGGVVKDPRLYTALELIVKDLYDIVEIVEPRETEASDEDPLPLTEAVDTFTFELTNRILRLSWTASDTKIRYYEIRKGSVWATATFVVRTSSLSVDLLPITEGSHTYLIRTLNADLAYSETESNVIVTVPNVGAPTITTQVIDNNVLLNWTEPSHTFDIDYYLVEKDGVEIGKVKGDFIAIFETVGDTYVYSVTAYDIAGNEGETANVELTVNQPPDFELLDTYTSAFAGTKTNVKLLDTGRLLCCVDTAETYNNHFASRAWASPQAQIDAGFPIYIQPTLLTGSYQETIDYGTEVNNVIIHIDWNYNPISGSVIVAGTFESSLDGVTWSNLQNGTSAFFASIRYLRLTITFTPSANTALMEFYNLQVLMDVKREIDSGEVTSLLTDLNGTQVLFNKTFKDISSITLDPKGTTPLTAIFRFVDAPNPTEFHVLVFDSAGNRVTALVAWKARGIV